MKKLIISSITLLFSFSYVFGQVENKDKGKNSEIKGVLSNLKGNEISIKSKERIIADFGDIHNVQWNKEGHIYKRWGRVKSIL